MAMDGTFRAPFACDPGQSRGRLHPEPVSKSRSAFRRDCDRIIHSTAFRRLKHKTQVFVFDEGDHYRTRLTHTLEVTQVSRALARALGVDEDLAEALALAHDLGHPPFGHAGERALDACLAAYRRLRPQCADLARRHRAGAPLPGLRRPQPDLGNARRPGQAQRSAHRRAMERRSATTASTASPRPFWTIRGMQDLQLWSYPSVEAQIAAFADDIAYDAHDIDDGLRAELFDLDDIATVALPGRIIGEIRATHPGLDAGRQVHELIRRLIGLLIEDVIAETSRKLAALAPSSADDVRQAKTSVAGFSPATAEADRAIKSFLKVRMYRHARVMHVMDQAAAVVRDLFARYSAHPGDLPAEWSEGLDGLEEAVRARRIADFIAGMTDRFALAEHARLFDSTPELR